MDLSRLSVQPLRPTHYHSLSSSCRKHQRKARDQDHQILPLLHIHQARLEATHVEAILQAAEILEREEAIHLARHTLHHGAGAAIAAAHHIHHRRDHHTAARRPHTELHEEALHIRLRQDLHRIHQLHHGADILLEAETAAHHHTADHEEVTLQAAEVATALAEDTHLEAEAVSVAAAGAIRQAAEAADEEVLEASILM